MTLPTQPVSLGHTFGLCSVDFWSSLVGGGPEFSTLLLASGCGGGCSPQKHCRMTLLAMAYRGKTKGPEWGTSLSDVGIQLPSNLPPRFSCFPSSSLEILEEQQQTHMCYRMTLDLAVHPAPRSPEACSSHSLPRFSNLTIIYPVIQAESLGIILHFPFPQPPHLIH